MKGQIYDILWVRLVVCIVSGRGSGEKDASVMEPILDFSWIQQIRIGRIRERFDFEAYRAVGVELPVRGPRKTPYFYRLLFFPNASEKPVLSINLESSILGTYCFTEHNGRKHINLGHADRELSYEDFRKWALEEAERVLH